MAAPPEVTIQTLAEFLEQVSTFQTAHPGPHWYRGSGRSAYKLQPSLFRHPTSTAPDHFANLEHQLLERFRQRSIPFHDRNLTDDWECLFFMQHFGIPTRLLDWTENPFIALHFALRSAPFDVVSGALRFNEDASVWLLATAAWNRHALSHLSYQEGPLSPSSGLLTSYKTGTLLNMRPMNPVAMYGTHNSPRIVAQRGVFTISGQDLEPMESIYDRGGYPAGCLTKIVLPVAALEPLSRALFSNGVTDSVIFPDLIGLAAELKWSFGFWR